MKPIISVENLGKRYRIQRKDADAPTNLRELLTDAPRRVFKGGTRTRAEAFWALQDVSFDIMPGERVGIIGRNGAGKSTLLKLLSRITEPTTGKITLRGRAASLLEVGTGFHPELTGRENIYLNGAILGMSRAEVHKKFDEIVDFSGVEDFLDTPVKRYSSGMYVRLGFAVAAHLEPEILIVDEVLAVGDMEFQKKCLGKMEEVSTGQGRTVLFVTHNMAMMAKLCTRGLWLQAGQCIFQGSMYDAISEYRCAISDSAENVFKPIQKKNELQFLSVYISDADGNAKNVFEHTDRVCLCVKIYMPVSHNNAEFALSMYDCNKNRIFTLHERLDKYFTSAEDVSLMITFPNGFIVPGKYSWLMCINIPNVVAYDIQDDVCAFSVVDTGSDFSAYPAGSYGSIKPTYIASMIG